ncbi:MAG TPA: TIGR01777 family oxidoreductase [Anaerolineales bacterium]|nr:TIGR01777 family oxidoreductase [Anaerolineales bacterium]
MRVLIAGGSGFLGTALRKSLEHNGHDVHILTRSAPRSPNEIQWDGETTTGWGRVMNEIDAVVNFTGYGLEHWPWNAKQKQKFLDSRTLPGRALTSAIQNASHPPRVLIQASGVNRYGLRGETIADESTPPARDFLAQLTVPWEDATKPVERLGIRRIVIRNAVVLARRGGLFPLMTLAPRLFFGGRFGDGQQAMPWIHVSDHIRATRFLLENEHAHGPFNLIAPQQTSNAEFMRAVARALRRPYWFHPPRGLLRLVLGEMSVLLTEGRFSQPKRLIELGFQFQFGTLKVALEDLLRSGQPSPRSTRMSGR